MWVWSIATLVAGCVVVGGGFVVVALSYLPVLRRTRPSVVLLLGIAFVTLAIQLVGMLAGPWTTIDSEPAFRVE